MKRYLIFTIMAAVLFVAESTRAQISVYNHLNRGNEDLSIYEYPKQVLDYRGTKIEAQGVVYYDFDKAKKQYEGVIFELKFKPLDADGFSAAVQDSIKKYAGPNTLIMVVNLDKQDGKRTFKGKAEMFARAFSAKSSNDDAEIEVKYSAVFNRERPEENSIKYSLHPGKWEKADKVVMNDDRKNISMYNFFSMPLHATGMKSDYQTGHSYPSRLEALVESFSRSPRDTLANYCHKWEERDVCHFDTIYACVKLYDEYKVAEDNRLGHYFLTDENVDVYKTSKQPVVVSTHPERGIILDEVYKYQPSDVVLPFAVEGKNPRMRVRMRGKWCEVNCNTFPREFSLSTLVQD